MKTVVDEYMTRSHSRKPPQRAKASRAKPARRAASASKARRVIKVKPRKASRPKATPRRKAVAPKGKPVKIAKVKVPKGGEKGKNDAFVNLVSSLVDLNQVEEVIKDYRFSDYLAKNVGKRAVEVISELYEPQTDEKIAEKLGVKINEVRRMLNILNSHSIVRYDVNKDSKGWLTFKWYLDREKIVEFGDKLEAQHNAPEFALQNDCNDFFVCDDCFPDQRVVLPFESAFELAFKCDCGNKLRQLNRDQAADMFKSKERLL